MSKRRRQQAQQERKQQLIRHEFEKFRSDLNAVPPESHHRFTSADEAHIKRDIDFEPKSDPSD
jgi:hypothetical protein